jgi:hypothetical protein
MFSVSVTIFISICLYFLASSFLFLKIFTLDFTNPIKDNIINIKFDNIKKKEFLYSIIIPSALI